jgi:multidrug efflux pump subunit AcrB
VRNIHHVMHPDATYVADHDGPAPFQVSEEAVRDRFRAIFLTSITTIAGMLPLLSETSLQAQVLIPLAASVVFGMVSVDPVIVAGVTRNLRHHGRPGG